MYILDDPLIFTHSDMDSSNFALDKDKRICMFGFRDIRVLPESFASYTLGSHDPFIRNVAAHLGWVGYPNRMSMTKARVVFITASDPTLGTRAITSSNTRADLVTGLDMHGIPKVRYGFRLFVGLCDRGCRIYKSIYLRNNAVYNNQTSINVPKDTISLKIFAALTTLFEPISFAFFLLPLVFIL